MLPSEARALLFARLLRDAPPPDRLFPCVVCKAVVKGRDVTIDELGRSFCGDCVGREPESG